MRIAIGRILVGGVIGFLSLFSGGCEQRGAAPALPPPTVSVVSVEERTLQDFVVFTGRTDAAETVDIRARVSGYLQSTHFKDGQIVAAGEMLFQIDPRPYQADFESAKGQYERAQSDLKLAAIEFKRADELRKKNTISAADYDAKAAALLGTQGAVSAAKAAMDKAALNLEFTAIKSPISGRIGKASVTPGNLITPDMQSPLATVVSINPIYAYADIDERQLLRYVRMNAEAKSKGEAETGAEQETPIYLQLADEKNFPHRGRIDFANNRVNPETGTILIRGVFDDPDDILGPGLFVRLRFPGGLPYGSLLVPQEAIVTDQGQKFVYVVNGENKVEYRRVEPGALQDDLWVAVKGDLRVGELVMVEGMLKVQPGQEVKTQPWGEKADVDEKGEPVETTPEVDPAGAQAAPAASPVVPAGSSDSNS